MYIVRKGYYSYHIEKEWEGIYIEIVKDNVDIIEMEYIYIYRDSQG